MNLKKFVVYEVTDKDSRKSFYYPKDSRKYYNIFTELDNIIEYISIVFINHRTFVSRISLKEDKFFSSEYSVEEVEFSSEQKRKSIEGTFNT